MGQRSHIGFCIVYADFFQSLLDPRVKKGAQLATVHYLVVCKLRQEKQTGIKRTCKTRRSYRVKGKALVDEDVKKISVDSVSSLLRELPEFRAEVEVGVAADQSSCSFISCTENGQKRLGVATDGKKQSLGGTRVKDAIRAKKIVYKICLQNKVESSVKLLYTEARKYAAQVATRPKCSLGRISGINWLPVTGVATSPLALP